MLKKFLDALARRVPYRVDNRAPNPIFQHVSQEAYWGVVPIENGFIIILPGHVGAYGRMAYCKDLTEVGTVMLTYAAADKITGQSGYNSAQGVPKKINVSLTGGGSITSTDPATKHYP